jgi:hypothetical protein
MSFFYKEEYHLSKCLDSYSHKKESEYPDDEMRTCFSESLYETTSIHDHESGDDTHTRYRDHTIEYTVTMHRDRVCHTRSREGEWECERYDESLIEILMDEVISLDFIDLGCVCFLTLYHRESYEEEYDSSGNTEILRL